MNSNKIILYYDGSKYSINDIKWNNFKFYHNDMFGDFYFKHGDDDIMLVSDNKNIIYIIITEIGDNKLNDLGI